VQASAAQSLYQQGEVARMLAWEKYTPGTIQSALITPVEEIAKAYKDSQGRGRDSRGAMLDVRA